MTYSESVNFGGLAVLPGPLELFSGILPFAAAPVCQGKNEARRGGAEDSKDRDTALPGGVRAGGNGVVRPIDDVVILVAEITKVVPRRTDEGVQ